jgi:virginiamycin B lyase
LLRIDARAGTSERIELGSVPYAVAVGLGSVWVADLVDPPETAEPAAGKVLRVDPATGKLDEVITVGKWPSGVAIGDGAVWVANGGDATISEIDPHTNEVVDRISTQYYPDALAYGHGFLWVSLHPEPFAF